ncbi:flagellar motor protein MotB [Aliidiomarina minuta]|uniref:Flagellar motor protein MotB n=1 Tax=Aliidiomarina minuta TaxID=880057 RepID=A0A432W4K5_9GAMM|nr:flagellar motor protein MotB [Aliidiomarina minuta]RUO24416.1 flagellar motor protein MotB [Aliidiomarina minuta]
MSEKALERKIKRRHKKGLAPWMATFADLMALLLCFFILLLSFSEMDVLKFKQIAGSMQYAFGVQNRIEVEDIPRGTSVIAQEFRPGQPTPTPIETIQQQTADMTQQTLDFQAGEDDYVGGPERDAGGETDAAEQAAEQAMDLMMQEQIEQAMNRIREEMEQEIEDGALELEQLGQQIIIRVREQGTFPEGSAFLQPQFRPVIRRIAEVLNTIPGEVTISGHTDNRRIRSEMHSSNWDLSSSRAVSVAEEMLGVENFNESRLTVRGLSDTRPLVPNNSADNRRRNRRVEIAVMQGSALESSPIEATNGDLN